MTAEARTDAKAGLSSMCRDKQHAMCKSAKARCSCSCHGPGGQQPATARANPIRRSPISSLPAKAKRRIGKVTVDLVWEDPPESETGRKPIVKQAAPLVEALREEPGRWARIATWDGHSSAASAAKRLREAYDDIEWVARKTDDGSTLWGRFPDGES